MMELEPSMSCTRSWERQHRFCNGCFGQSTHSELAQLTISHLLLSLVCIMRLLEVFALTVSHIDNCLQHLSLKNFPLRSPPPTPLNAVRTYSFSGGSSWQCSIWEGGEQGDLTTSLRKGWTAEGLLGHSGLNKQNLMRIIKRSWPVQSWRGIQQTWWAAET